MQQEGDDTIHAEVIRNRAAHARVIHAARHVADARKQLADERFTLLQLTHRLAWANAYRRLRHHITSTLTPATSSLSS